MKYVSIIKIEDSDCNELNVNGTHIVATATAYDENRCRYHHTMIVLDIASGMSATATATQYDEESYYHHAFLPMYRTCCKKIGVEPCYAE